MYVYNPSANRRASMGYFNQPMQSTPPNAQTAQPQSPSFDLGALGYAGGGMPSFQRTKLSGVSNPAMLDSLFGGGLAGLGYGSNWINGFVNQARNAGTTFQDQTALGKSGSNPLVMGKQQGQPQGSGGISYGYKT